MRGWPGKEPSVSRVVVRLLGPWEMSVAGHVLPKPSTQKAQSLLAYLILREGIAQPREKLAGLFWPDADEDRAQRSLRTALWSLRRLLEEGVPGYQEGLAATRFDVRWAPSFEVEVDCVRFEETARRGLARKPVDAEALAALQTAAATYRGPLLEGFYDD